MAKELNGLELQGFIKERQLRQVRNLRQEHKIIPTLLIIKSNYVIITVSGITQIRSSRYNLFFNENFFLTFIIFPVPALVCHSCFCIPAAYTPVSF